MDKKLKFDQEGKSEFRRPEEEQFRVDGGGLVLWLPKRHGSRNVPAVTVGAFRSGVPCVHFRKHKIDSPFVLTPTQEGISLSFLELDGIMARIRALADLLAIDEGPADAA